MNDQSSFGSPRASQKSKKRLWTRGFQYVYVVRTTGHTGVELVSRTGYLSSVILSPHFLQTILEYIHDLGRLVR